MDKKKALNIKSVITTVFTLLLVGILTNCEDEIRNIAEINESPSPDLSREVNPLDINVDGFDLLEKMQGHWTGPLRIIADDFDWFAFDYRAISPSHIHGIFEGGSAGNLLTSFFVTDFKNTRTIMARNGGLLNGIYRSSYFVLDSIRYDADDSKYFRLVDANGGAAIMYMELRFKSDSLYFNAYTSRLGLNLMPVRHMTFRSSRKNPELALEAAQQLGFPQNNSAWDFSSGFRQDLLYINPGDTEPKSATFLAQQTGSNDVFTLADESRDPFRIQDHPYLGYLTVNIVRNTAIEGKSWFLYLSKEPLTDSNGIFISESFSSVLRFPEIIATENSFNFTYMHPGEYYVTVIADANEDGSISAGDITHVSQKIQLSPEQTLTITIDNINIQN